MYGGWEAEFFSLKSWSFLFKLGSASYRPKNNYLSKFSSLFLFSNASFSNCLSKKPLGLNPDWDPDPANSPSQDRIQMNLDMKHWLIQDKIQPGLHKKPQTGEPPTNPRLSPWPIRKKSQKTITNQEAGLLGDATEYASALPWVCCWPPADVGPKAV